MGHQRVIVLDTGSVEALAGTPLAQALRSHPGMPLDRSAPAPQDQPMATERVRKLLAAAAELPTEERAQLVHEFTRTLLRPLADPMPRE